MSAEIRLAEVIASISLATDLGMGQPLEQGLRMAAVAVGLGRRVSCSDQELSDIYYLALVQHIGCTADAHEFSLYVGGDDLAFRTGAITLPSASPPETLRHFVRNLAGDRPLPERTRLVAGMLAGGRRRFAAVTAAHCEAAARIADRLGMSDGVRRGLAEMHERWDGRGMPGGAGGDGLSKVRRVVHVAHDAVVLTGTRGVAAAMATTRSRRGRAYDPGVVDVFVENAHALLERDGGDAWESALDAEPGPPIVVPASRLDSVARACADFADLKSPFLTGHSSRVAEMAVAGARVMGCTPEELTILRRAAHFHDLGRVGVPNGIWERAGALGVSEMERVRLHPYHTERILARSPVLAPYAVIAGSHHENVDGSGYHRGIGGGQLSRLARLLRVADACEAMCGERPHRRALSPEERVRTLAAAVEAGRLDPAATRAVLEGAGERARIRAEWPAGLTEREVEVLRLLIQGETNRQMAARLGISEKTIGHHVEHIYNKIGVSSRAGAALFAMENDIVL